MQRSETTPKRWTRRREDSLGRTVSESSEGWCTSSDMDAAEDISYGGSLSRSSRSRLDSAYRSQRESLLAGTPDTDCEYILPHSQGGMYASCFFTFIKKFSSLIETDKLMFFMHKGSIHFK